LIAAEQAQPSKADYDSNDDQDQSAILRKWCKDSQPRTPDPDDREANGKDAARSGEQRKNRRQPKDGTTAYALRGRFAGCRCCAHHWIMHPVATTGSRENSVKSIGEASKLSGIKIETIRYYEREGVIARTIRSGSGRRLFGSEDIAQLRFIRRSRDLGFSLADIKALSSLGVKEENACSDAQEIGGRHLENVRSKIRDLKELEAALAQLVSSCKAGDPSCAMLDELFQSQE